MSNPPAGITPPTPGLDHEEPEFNTEADIPTDDGNGWAMADLEELRE